MTKCAWCHKEIIMVRPFHLEDMEYCSGVCARKAEIQNARAKGLEPEDVIKCAQCHKDIVMVRPFVIDGKPYCSGLCQRKAEARNHVVKEQS